MPVGRDNPGFSLSVCIGIFVFCCAQINSLQAADSVPVSKVLELVTSMEASWAKVNDYTKVIEKTERLIDGSVKYERGTMKFRKPDQHYLRVDEGMNEGSEIIYPMPGGKNLAIAHPGGLTGSMIRIMTRTPLIKGLVPTIFSIRDPKIIKGQHHTIADSNLGSVIRLISSNLRTAARYAEGSVQLYTDASFDGRPVYKIQITLPGNVGTRHVVRRENNLWTIAQKYNQNRYVILYHNANVLSSVDPGSGQVIFIPRYYAPRGDIWVSKQSLLPVKLEIYDSDGNLYESYVYSSIEINPGLTDLDFDPWNPAYRF
ncbi:DUF1571 domain-containing protein [Gammaproteobacteria bacterium]|nr:DUF1571 domain-containing protein [Gammaproteobacteria bacterium]